MVWQFLIWTNREVLRRSSGQSFTQGMDCQPSRTQVNGAADLTASDAHVSTFLRSAYADYPYSYSLGQVTWNSCHTLENKEFVAQR